MISILAYWSCTIITGGCFYPLSKFIGPFAILIVYAVPAAICFLFLLITMPETKEREVADIIAEIFDRRARMTCGERDVKETKKRNFDLIAEIETNM